MLTSEADASAHLFAHRVAAAVEAGCGGLVCAAAEVGRGQAAGAPHARVVRPASARPAAPSHDQARPATPAAAIAAGADLLVHRAGRDRPRPDPVAAAVAVVAEVEAGRSLVRSRRRHPTLGCRSWRILPA